VFEVTDPTIQEQLARYRQEGHGAMDEAESKQLLARYGVPVVTEAAAADPDEAAALAEDMGFPVVLKALGRRLIHKTEQDLVRVNLQRPDQVRRAFEAVRAGAGADWEACLVQPMVEGRREFVAGLMRDAQFGPVVMFGLGGIFAEAIGDSVFRIAPFSEAQALAMTEELTASTLLDDFRGEAAADREELVRVLSGLSRLGAEHPEIREVDINPLIISAEGRVTAVDALVMLSEDDDSANPSEPSEQEGQARADEINAALDQMAHPRSIAVVGAARAPTGGFPGMFACVRNFGFPGKLYPVNPKADEIDGIKAYPSLTALPEPVDLVIISVPGPRVPEALRDCTASGNKNIHIFSSGFQETGEPEGIRLHEEIKEIAEQGGLNIVGPNCMGFYVPESRLMTWIAAAKESGPLAFITQSGGHAQDFTCYAASQLKLYFSKVISYGNALTLDSPDFLEYLGDDEKTRIIAMYMEGVKDGRRLFRLVKAVNRKKPIVMLKAGLTESGARTVASHTGSMAGGQKIWQAFFRQTGTVAVESLEEMAETAMALDRLPRWTGRNIAILGTGGGIGVAAADSCAKTGLHLSTFSTELLEQLREYIPPAGNMIRNPIDAHILLLKLELMGPVLELLAAQAEIDMFVVSLHFDWLHGIENGAHAQRIGAYIAEESRRHTGGKPLAVVWRQYQPDPGIQATRQKVVNTLLQAGVPTYNGLDRALTALSKAESYYAFQENRGIRTFPRALS